MPEENEIEGMEFEPERPPKRERPKSKFETPKQARMRMLVGGFYRLQGVRIALSNGIAGIGRDYPKTYSPKEAELDTNTFVEPIREQEEAFAKLCWEAVKEEPIAKWLRETVKGMGPVLIAQLVGLIGDIKLFLTISKLWAYSGLTPGQRRRAGEKSDHAPALKRLLFNIATSFLKARGFYSGAYGHFKAEEERKARRFMSLLKDELRASADPRAAEVLGRIETEEKLAAQAKAKQKVFSFAKFLKAVYDGALTLGFEPSPALRGNQFRLFTDAVKYLTARFGLAGTPALTPAHRHARAFRKVEKLFLQHLWLKWRTLEGQPVTDPWIFTAKGGHDKARMIPPPESRDDEFPSREAAEFEQGEEVA